MPLLNTTGTPVADDFEDLEQQLAQEAAPQNQGFVDDTFSELDELLAKKIHDAQAKQALQGKVAAARERLKRGGTSAAERAEDLARIARWEALYEWKDDANVALYHRFSCACGAHSTVFEAMMRKQQHRHLRDSRRWVAADSWSPDLPNEVAIRKTSTPICPKCSEGKGFGFRNVTEWA